VLGINITKEQWHNAWPMSERNHKAKLKVRNLEKIYILSLLPVNNSNEAALCRSGAI